MSLAILCAASLVLGALLGIAPVPVEAAYWQPGVNYALNISPVPAHGRVKSNPEFINCGSSVPSPVCTDYFTPGTQVTLTATPDSLYRFVRWVTPAGNPTMNPLVFTMPGTALTVTAEFALITPPGAPGIGLATPGNAQATIAFTAPASDGGSPITSYRATCNPGNRSATGTASPITVTSLANGTAYSCSVTATNAAGTGPASGAVSVTPRTVPGAPTIGTAVPGNGQATISFSPPASNGGSAITSYLVTCTWTGPGSQSASGSGSPITVTGLSNMTTWSCTVAAINAAGTGPPSGTVSFTTPTFPGAPVIGGAIPGDRQATISFSPPASNGGMPITGYAAVCMPGSIQANGMASPITVSGLANGTSYSCYVAASNAIGWSTPSGTVNVVPQTVPGAPIIRTADPGNGQVTLSFTPPDSSGGSPITGYLATCNPGGIVASATSSPITVTGLTNGAAYTCSVAATTAAGTGPGSSSVTVTPRTVPGAPLIGTAMPRDGQATISFSPPASNGGSPITGYQATCQPGAFWATGTGSPITVGGLANGTRYTCSVTATNAAGVGPASATVTVTPDARAGAVFPMTVNSSIGATTTTVSVVIWPRTQDEGKVWNVYVFAIAPSNRVQPAAAADAFTLGKSTPAGDEKASSVACVLAQLNASGQLKAVSISSLQAYVTGVLSSAGQAVTIVNGVATANIAGATFYVGYGSSPTDMIVTGVNRSVVSIPSEQLCQPQAPQTGWWWNAAEDGRGYTIESTGSKLFFAAYLYDISGRSTWYIAAGPTSLDGSVFVGDLESYTNGQTLAGPFRPPVRPPVLNGQITLAFNDAHHGTLTWPGGTVPITRMEYGVGGVNAVPLDGQPENGWWLSGLDDGRGFFIEWQAGIGFMAGFMYDEAGAPVWYIAAKTTPDNPQVFSSQWEQYVNGQTLTGTYHPPVRPPTYVGAATIQFQGAADAIMTMPGGRQVTLSRYRF